MRSIVLTLNSIDKPLVRMEVYEILKKLRDACDASNLGPFLENIDKAICDLFYHMQDKDLTVIHRSTNILAEITDQGVFSVNWYSSSISLLIIAKDLIRDDLKFPTDLNGQSNIPNFALLSNFCDSLFAQKKLVMWLNS